MSIVTKVAKMRLFFHANMLDVCNVANQLGILKDEKAEEIMKGHTMKCFDAMEHMGLDSTRSEITEVSENIEYVCE